MPDSQIKVTLKETMGSDLTVVNAARVSFNKESKWANQADYDENHYGPDSKVQGILSDRDTKLIHYLAKHKHYSPFGHCFASFLIEAPVFVARQLVKHEYLRMNEVSRRYVDDEPDFYTPGVWRSKSDDKKQGSGEALDDYTASNVDRIIANQHRNALDAYDTMLAMDVAPEQARMVLPQSMMTQWWWSGSLDAFYNMYALRSKEDTQHETRLVANQIGDIMSQRFPVSWEALNAWED